MKHLTTSFHYFLVDGGFDVGWWGVCMFRGYDFVLGLNFDFSNIFYKF
jgi:hypothetical protein